MMSFRKTVRQSNALLSVSLMLNLTPRFLDSRISPNSTETCVALETLLIVIMMIFIKHPFFMNQASYA